MKPNRHYSKDCTQSAIVGNEIYSFFGDCPKFRQKTKRLFSGEISFLYVMGQKPVHLKVMKIGRNGFIVGATHDYFKIFTRNRSWGAISKSRQNNSLQPSIKFRPQFNFAFHSKPRRYLYDLHT